MPTLLLAALLASRPIPVATACNTENEVCREGCTLEFGTTQRTRVELARCMEACGTTHARCTERWKDVHENDLEQGALDDRSERTVLPEPERPTPPPVDDEIKMPTDEQLRNIPWEKKKKRAPNDAAPRARPTAPAPRR